MTSEGLGKMFKGNFAEICADKFPLVSMGGRAEGLAWADPGARTPIGASGNFLIFKGGMSDRNVHLETSTTGHRGRNKLD